MDRLLLVEASAFAALEVAEPGFLGHGIGGFSDQECRGDLVSLPPMNATVPGTSSFPRRSGAGFGTWAYEELRSGCRDISGPVPPSLLIRLKREYG
jgi:hypothetical protein